MWVMKNWLPLVFAPALAIDSEPIWCLRVKFSSAKRYPGPPAAGTSGVATLNHKVGNDTMELGAVVKAFAR
jgi:hypothetical protein